MMAEPLVSVLVTAYNRERYLGASLESVLAQRFGDFELIVVDDCSSDGTLDLAHEWASRDERVRVHANPVNRGHYPNRNHAATPARAPLMKYHDSDDVMYPHCLETMVPPMLEEPVAAFGLSSGSTWPGGPCPMQLTPRMCYQREFLGSGLFSCGASGAIFRSDWFRDQGGFVDHGAASDYVFWLTACRRAHALLLPADLFWYRTHAGQELRSETAARNYAAASRLVWRALNDADCPLSELERLQARRNVMGKFAVSIGRELRARRYRLAWIRWSGGPSVIEWLRYFRPPRRTVQAGTPLDGDGEYLVNVAHRTTGASGTRADVDPPVPLESLTR